MDLLVEQKLAGVDFQTGEKQKHGSAGGDKNALSDSIFVFSTLSFSGSSLSSKLNRTSAVVIIDEAAQAVKAPTLFLLGAMDVRVLKGKVRKVLKVEPLPDGSGHFFNLSVQNKLANMDESIYIPVTRAELTVLVSAFNIDLALFGGEMLCQAPAEAVKPLYLQYVYKICRT